MAGLAERYWNELRPSAAGQCQLELGSQFDRATAPASRRLRRPARRVRPGLRSTARKRSL